MFHFLDVSPAVALETARNSLWSRCLRPCV
jgi:hypothetical protein